MIVDELKKKRATLETEVQAAEARIRTLRNDIGAIDRVIGLYDPDHAPALVRQKKKRTASVALPEVLANANKTAAILDALREAGQPITTAQCIATIVDRFQVELDHDANEAFVTHVSASLSSLVNRGRVRHAGMVEGNRRLWEIAA